MSFLFDDGYYKVSDSGNKQGKQKFIFFRSAKMA